MRFWILALVLAACGESGGSESADGEYVADTDGGGRDAVDVTDGTDASDATEGTDASDATDATLPDGTDATDGRDADGRDGDPGGDATDSGDATDAPDGSDGTDATDGPPGPWEPPPPQCLPPTGGSEWQVLDVCRDGALLSVAGTEWYDVWMVGAKGTALRWNGCGYESLDTGTTEDLWWVHRTPGSDPWVVGSKGTALRYTKDGTFQPTVTGTTATLYGVWGPSAGGRTVAVGFDPKVPNSAAVLFWDESDAASGIWGQGVLINPPADNPQPFKVTGRDNDIWIVGRDDLVWFFGPQGPTAFPTGAGADGDWVTVALTPDGDPVLVGGAAKAIIATRADEKWTIHEPESLPGLQGVCFGADGKGVATGLSSVVLRYDDGSWAEDVNAPFGLFNPFDPPVPGCVTESPDYHACWIDPFGAVWAVGGSFLTLRDGAAMRFGQAIPAP